MAFAAPAAAHSRPTKQHFSQSLRSYPTVLPVHTQPRQTEVLGEALGGTQRGKGAGPGSAPRRSAANVHDPGHAVRAQPQANRSALYGRPYTTTGTGAGVAVAYGVDRRPQRTRGKAAGAPEPDAPVALDASGRSVGSAAFAASSSDSALHGTARVAAAVAAEQQRRLRPPTHKPTVQTYGHVSVHLKHTLTPAQLRKRLWQHRQQQLAQSQSQSQEAFAESWSDSKFADSALSASESVGGAAAGNGQSGAAGAGAGLGATADASDFDVDASGLNRIARAKKALGVLRMGRVNPSFVSRYFASFRPQTREDVPLPRTPNALSATQPLAGTGATRTSLFGLVPTTYTDIRVDAIGKVIARHTNSTRCTVTCPRHDRTRPYAFVVSL